MVTTSNSKMTLMTQLLCLVISIRILIRKVSIHIERWSVATRARIKCHRLRTTSNIWLIVENFRFKATNRLSSQEVCPKTRVNWNHSCRVSTTWTIIKTAMVGHQSHHTRQVAKAVLDMSHLDYKSIYNLTRKQCSMMQTKRWKINSNHIEHLETNREYCKVPKVKTILNKCTIHGFSKSERANSRTHRKILIDMIAFRAWSLRWHISNILNLTEHNLTVIAISSVDQQSTSKTWSS